MFRTSYIKHRPKNFVTRAGRVITPSPARRLIDEAVQVLVICLVISAVISAVLVEVSL